MTLPTYLASQCDSPCRDLRCRDSVRFRAETHRWYITIGHAGFNTRANNAGGYRSERAARAILQNLMRPDPAKVGSATTIRTKPCDCWAYPRMHDSRGVCVNWEQHGGEPCGLGHATKLTKENG